MTGAIAKATSLGTPVEGVYSLSGQFLLEIPALACLLGWTSGTTKGEDIPDGDVGQKAVFKVSGDQIMLH